MARWCGCTGLRSSRIHGSPAEIGGQSGGGCGPQRPRHTARSSAAHCGRSTTGAKLRAKRPRRAPRPPGHGR
jgi:hypothetical protein